jgi:L-asparaginase II
MIPLVETIRGEVVEAVHRGALAIMDRDGHLIAHVGNPDLVVLMRSSAKPFQLLPLIESGAVERLGLTERELAVMAASHSGSQAHVTTVAGILEKLGLDESALLCGTHTPIDRSMAESLIRADASPSPLHNNCSGKHAGMLAYAVSRGWPTDDYTDPMHPVQKEILQALAEMADCPINEIHVAVDGCSVPVFGLELRHAALAYARLADPAGLPEPRRQACRRIVAAMTAYPGMVAGDGRFDTVLMQAGAGGIVAKGGAEGYQGIGILSQMRGGGVGLGLALKIEDGNGRRAVAPAALEALRQIEVLEHVEPSALRALDSFGPRILYNHREMAVGRLASVFQLAFSTLEPVA